MSYQTDNAVIMAAGISSRFAPLSYEKPKALMEVKGEILIERQIRQLLEAGIQEIIVVVGYQKEKFYYLRDKYPVTIVENKEYLVRNNHSSIYAARKYLRNTYICSADNYFAVNPFEKEVDNAYYAAVFSPGETSEWCLKVNDIDVITEVVIGGSGQWYMLGHVFWSEDFSRRFLQILEKVYDEEDTKDKLWEAIYREHIQELPLKIKRYPDSQIYEFDSLDELRLFDSKYMEHSGSRIMEKLAKRFDCPESAFTKMEPLRDEDKNTVGVSFQYDTKRYEYYYSDEKVTVADCGRERR